MFIVIATLIFIIPFLLLAKDVKKTLYRYGLITDNLKGVKKEKYIHYAKTIFKKYKKVNIFVFGHTHSSYIIKDKNNIIVNTGTWLKRFKKIKPWRPFVLPSVYYPNYRLSITKISSKKKKIIVEHLEFHKKAKIDLTLLQKFVIFLRRKYPKRNLDTKTIDL